MNVLTLCWLGRGTIKNVHTKAGVNIKSAVFMSLVWIDNIRTKLTIIPVANITRSVVLNSPNISMDFFELAGIK